MNPRWITAVDAAIVVGVVVGAGLLAYWAVQDARRERPRGALDDGLKPREADTAQAPRWKRDVLHRRTTR